MSTVAKSLFAPVTELWDEPKSATLRAIEDTKSQNQNSSETVLHIQVQRAQIIFSRLHSLPMNQKVNRSLLLQQR